MTLQTSKGTCQNQTRKRLYPIKPPALPHLSRTPSPSPVPSYLALYPPLDITPHHPPPCSHAWLAGRTKRYYTPVQIHAGGPETAELARKVSGARGRGRGVIGAQVGRVTRLSNQVFRERVSCAGVEGLAWEEPRVCRQDKDMGRVGWESW
ncbi:hypothetical protein P171DRAFT_170123 [Karstenula rhodostoma CBS 690.94]|uniref:Uncharacterized protein n=1 Tax=Karstenula rhodostoma CBS 690.94 TaxID=1392251 RepID=A0A9P4P846_9PLEO|nr:hypothetical protein P171DRAFT_170123 [Karstenula rhodostoma CBS 690.94]